MKKNFFVIRKHIIQQNKENIVKQNFTDYNAQNNDEIISMEKLIKEYLK